MANSNAAESRVYADFSVGSCGPMPPLYFRADPVAMNEWIARPWWYRLFHRGPEKEYL